MSEENKKPISEYTFPEMTKLIEQEGSARKAAASLGVAKSTFNDHMTFLRNETFREEKLLNPIQMKPQGKVSRWILTAAQDETKPFEPFLRNLEAYAEYLNADILISGFTYNKRLFEDHDKHNGWYHPRITEYLSNDRIELGDKVVFCGEMNTLPTAVRPLSGFERYTGSKWGIFPHAKFQLVSLPTQKHLDTKVIMTTGVVTKPNYVKKKAGLKAEYDHIYGAVLVEVEEDGRTFVRHLHGSARNGAFNDLDIKVTNGRLYFDQRVEAINWPDIHVEKMEWDFANTCWGRWGGHKVDDPIIEVLRPKVQLIHDVTDFMSRNYHNVDDPHFMYEMYMNGTDSVEDNIKETADFLDTIQFKGSKIVVVESNHDLHFEKWLKTADYRKDPVNAEYFLECQREKYRAIRERIPNYSVLKHAVERLNPNVGDIKWLDEDESYRICTSNGDGGIECGLHGHLGPNGVRGAPMQFTKFGPKINIGHGHSAWAADGLYRSGVFTLDMTYNRGPSNWNRSFVVSHTSGKRQIGFIDNDGYWRSQY